MAESQLLVRLEALCTIESRHEPELRLECPVGKDRSMAQEVDLLGPPGRQAQALQQAQCATQQPWRKRQLGRFLSESTAGAIHLYFHCCLCVFIILPH